MTTDMFHISDTSFPSLLAPSDLLALGIDPRITDVPDCELISPQLVLNDSEGDLPGSIPGVFPSSIDGIG